MLAYFCFLLCYLVMLHYISKANIVLLTDQIYDTKYNQQINYNTIFWMRYGDPQGEIHKLPQLRFNVNPTPVEQHHITPQTINSTCIHTFCSQYISLIINYECTMTFCIASLELTRKDTGQNSDN